jgi:hypothetical protein
MTTNMKQLTVYLDTTYCDGDYDFPSQDAAVSAITRSVVLYCQQLTTLFRSMQW